MKDLETPLILVNFKSYKESLGENAVKLARIVQGTMLEKGVYIGIAPQYVDLKFLCESFNIPVFAQHADPEDPGAHTGRITIDSIKSVGAEGVIINHSERRMRISDIGVVIKKAKKLDLRSVVCADTPLVSAAVSALDPEIVAIEPPELIGSGIPVSKARPEIIRDTVALIKKTNPAVIPLCGAGITRGEDVVAAFKLGAKGVLVASGIVKARDPEKALHELAEAARHTSI